MQPTHGILLWGLNTPSLLSRISLALSRHRVNVRQLRMQSSEDGRFASYQVILACEKPVAERLQRQLSRIVELLEVSLHVDFESVKSESMGFSDKVPTDDNREGIRRELLKAV